MNANFADLELFAQQPIGFDVAALLSAAIPIDETASLHELFELLESAVESYTLVQNRLAAVYEKERKKRLNFSCFCYKNG